MNSDQNQEYTGFETNPPPEEKKPPLGAAIKSMVFGILSIEFGFAPIFSIVAIIFAALARKWSLPIIENYPFTSARHFAKAGRITGSVGLGVSIAGTVFWALYFGIIAFAVVLAILYGEPTPEVMM